MLLIPPLQGRVVTDFGQPASTSHVSEFVLSIVKFGGSSRLMKNASLGYRDRAAVGSALSLDADYVCRSWRQF